MRKNYGESNVFLGKPKHKGDRSAQMRALNSAPVSDKFPINEPFKSREECLEYVSGDKIQCLICGREFNKALGAHLSYCHGLNGKEYKLKYQIPTTIKLVTKAYKEERSKGISDAQRLRMSIMGKEGKGKRGGKSSIKWVTDERKVLGKKHRSDGYWAKLKEQLPLEEIWASKKSMNALSKQYGVSWCTIRLIKNTLTKERSTQ